MAVADFGLERLDRCFQAVIPAVLATCSRDGEPNIIAVSYVHRIDEHRIAVSRQFFRKTHANLAENPRARVVLTDPTTMEMWRLALRFDHEEATGPLFETMSARVEAVASMTGMSGVFRLQAVDVFEVLAVEEVRGVFVRGAETAGEPLAVAIDSMTQLRVLRRIGDCIRVSEEASALLDAVLEILDDVLGFTHAMMLLVDETGDRLYAIASRGYSESGVGAEVRVGDGLIGTVAKTRKLIRIASLDRALRYGRAVRSSAAADIGDEIPLPGLPDAESCVAIPLLAKSELIGVLAVESRKALAYGERDEAFLEVVAGQLALALNDLVRRSDESEVAPPKPHAVTAMTGPARRVLFYPADDSVFVDGQYLIRNVPGRILWKLLRAYQMEGRTEFSNRELRLDPALGLPSLRDNLESRLILLRKRLAEKCPEIALVSSARGRLTLEVRCAIELVER
jgi:hypothetical protein